MNFESNPFNLLEVNTKTPKEKIIEIAEDKSFLADNEQMEKTYENAKYILLNPQKRILAEISWFCGSDELQVQAWLDKIKKGKEVHSPFPNPLCEFNYIKYSIENQSLRRLLKKIYHLDNLYKQLTQETLSNIINQEREQTEFPFVQDTSMITRGKQELREDIHNSFLKARNKLKTKEAYINQIHAFASEALKNAPVCGMIIDDVVSTYRLDLNEEIEKRKNRIYKTADEILAEEDSTKFHGLISQINKIAKILEPIELLNDNKGVANESKAQDIGKYLIDTAVAYTSFNEVSGALSLLQSVRTSFSYNAMLQRRCDEQISRLEEILHATQEDDRNCSSAQRDDESVTAEKEVTTPEDVETNPFNDAMEKLTTILEEIKQTTYLEPGHEETNTRFCTDVFAEQYSKQIYAIVHDELLTEEELKNLYILVANIYARVAQAWYWTGNIKEAVRNIESAYAYANKGENKNSIDDIKKLRDTYKNLSFNRISSSKNQASCDNTRKFYNSSMEWIAFWKAIAIIIFFFFGIIEDGVFLGILTGGIALAIVYWGSYIVEHRNS